MTTAISVQTLLVDKAAAEVLREANRQATHVAKTWHSHTRGNNSTRAHKMRELAIETLTSYSHNATELFSAFFGSTSTVHKDGPLSLFVRTSSGLVFGVIFHRAHDVDAPGGDDIIGGFGSPAPVSGAYCSHVDPVDHLLCLRPVCRGKCETHGEVTERITLPVPGTWAFHS